MLSLFVDHLSLMGEVLGECGLLRFYYGPDRSTLRGGHYLAITTKHKHEKSLSLSKNLSFSS